MSEFKREERYIVIKLTDVKALEGADQQLPEYGRSHFTVESLRGYLRRYGIPTRKCVVVEEDWPNYEDTWKAVEQVAAGMYEPGEVGKLRQELTAARDEAERLRGILHSREMHPDFEYATTDGPRKAWYDEDVSPEGDGWEPNIHKGRDGWERFDYHEEAYWMRFKKIDDLDAGGGK